MRFWTSWARKVLEFEEDGHVYSYGGKVIPSVTQILDPIKGYDGIPEHIMRTASERGTEVHRITELYDYGTLVDYDRDLAGYLDAWIAFLALTGFEMLVSEARMFDETLGYAGTVDRIGTCNKKNILLDIKTTYKFMPSVGPQTAAYQRLWDAKQPGEKINERWSVRLMPDGKFERKILKSPSDFNVFNSCLNIWRWRESNGS